MKKRILSVMLVLCMVIGMMPAAFADDVGDDSVDSVSAAVIGEAGDDGVDSSNVAAIGDSEYATLAEAVESAQDGDIIRLLTDATSSQVTIAKKLTIDMGGHSVTGPDSAFWLNIDGGNLTITGNGTFTGYAAAQVVGNQTPGGNAINSTLTVKSGSFTGTELGILYVGNGATVVVDGGSITGGDNAAIMGNGTKNSSTDNGGTSLIVNDGTITGNTLSAGWRNCAIYLPQWGTAVINGGTITGTTGAGIVLRSGNLTITGGQISGKGTGGDDCKMGDANPTYCGGLEIGYSCNYPGSIGNIEISGGNFSSETSDAVKVIGSAADSTVEATKASTISITGGSFTTDPSDYVTGDYKAVRGEDGLYTIGTKTYVASNSTASYETLADTIANAAEGDTVTLLADTTEDITIPAGKNLTLDLSGKTLTNTNAGKATLTIAEGATAHVKNGSITGGTSYYNIDNYGTVDFTNVTATAGNNDSSMIRNKGTMTINSGNYINGLNTVKNEEDCDLIINNGTFETDSRPGGYIGVIFNAGHATIYDGQFTTTDTTADKQTATMRAVFAMQTNAAETKTTTDIKGGTFVVKNAHADASVSYGGKDPTIIQITGGSYSPKPISYSVADGYAIVNKTSSNPYYTIAPAKKITIESAEHGRISSAPSAEAVGANVTLNIKADTGYILDTITITKDSSGEEVYVHGNSTKQYFTMPDDNVIIRLTFKVADYKITVKATNGTVTAPETAQYGDKVALSVNADPGYELSSIKVKQASKNVTLNKDNTFTMPAGAVAITATFKAIPYTITVADAENGSVSVNAETSTVGTAIPVTVSPNEGYELDELYYTEENSDEHHAIEAVDGAYTLTMPAAPVTLHATFKEAEYTVSIASGIENGSLKTDPEKAHRGDTVTVTATPDEGYELDTITVTTGDDQPVAVKDGKFTMPAGNVTVSASFKKVVYTVSVDKDIKNGKVSVDPETATVGDSVTVTATSDEGYELEAITVTADGKDVAVKDGKFTMPAGNVTVSATFKKAAAPSPEPSVSTTTTVSTDVSTDIPSADKKAIEAVLDDASVEGIEKAADTGDILDAAGVTEADTKAKKVEIEITTKVIAEGADLSAGTLTFSAAPVATITIDGKKVSKDVPVTNDMLNGKNITIKLPLPKGFVPEEIIHISNDGLRQHYTAQDFKVETAENGGQVAVLKITHFSQFILNAKTHVHTWDQGTVITEPTATTDGTMHYVCTVCGDEKDEVIPAVPATQLTLDPVSVRLAVGKTQALTLTVVPENATGTVVWSSSNSAVATVDETGNVTAVAAGTTAITAVLGTQTAVATISVVCGTDTCQYYTDVDAGAWYHPAVDFVTEHKLMQGVDTKARTFVPGHELTRAQLAQVLYNMENPGDTASEKSFKDVKQGAWYYNAVIWAADNGIVKGYEDGCFYPNRPITREQMVTMLYRYMQFKGLKVDASSEDWKSFNDYANVHAWAQDAMAWAVHNGVVNGIQNNQLAPTHTAQRSQVAKIIMEITMLYDLA